MDGNGFCSDLSPEMLFSQDAARCVTVTWMGCYGHDMHKPTHLASNMRPGHDCAMLYNLVCRCF